MSALQNSLLGGQGMARTERMLADLHLDVATRGVPELPYTVYGLLWHLELSQHILLRQLAGELVTWPPSAEQWPQQVPDEVEFQALLTRLQTGLKQAADLAADPDALPAATRDTLEDLCAHNAYHWGQVVTLRRLLGDWPPV